MLNDEKYIGLSFEVLSLYFLFAYIVDILVFTHIFVSDQTEKSIDLL